MDFVSYAPLKLGRLSLASTSNTDATYLRIVPIPNIVLIMRTRLSLGLHMVSEDDTSEVDRFSVATMCHDTERESFEHRVILFIPLLQFIKTSDLKTLVAFEGAERSGSFHSASGKTSLAVRSPNSFNLRLRNQ